MVSGAWVWIADEEANGGTIGERVKVAGVTNVAPVEDPWRNVKVS